MLMPMYKRTTTEGRVGGWSGELYESAGRKVQKSRATTPSFDPPVDCVISEQAPALGIGRRSRENKYLPRSRLPASLTADLPHVEESDGAGEVKRLRLRWMRVNLGESKQGRVFCDVETKECCLLSAPETPDGSPRMGRSNVSPEWRTNRKMEGERRKRPALSQL